MGEYELRHGMGAFKATLRRFDNAAPIASTACPLLRDQNIASRLPCAIASPSRKCQLQMIDDADRIAPHVRAQMSKPRRHKLSFIHSHSTHAGRTRTGAMVTKCLGPQPQSWFQMPAIFE